jgi:hypothetical protein
VKPTYRIDSFQFNAIQKNYFITFIDTTTQEINTLSAYTLSRQKQLINGFSSEDAHRIGYMAGLDEHPSYNRTNTSCKRFAG